MWNNLKQNPICSSLPLPKPLITRLHLPKGRFQPSTRPHQIVPILPSPINSTWYPVAHPKSLIIDRVFNKSLPIIHRPFPMHHTGQNWQKFLCTMRPPPVLESAKYHLELRIVALLRICSWSWLSSPHEYTSRVGSNASMTLRLLVF